MAVMCSLETIKELLKRNADVNARNNEGFTALDRAPAGTPGSKERQLRELLLSNGSPCSGFEARVLGLGSRVLFGFWGSGVLRLGLLFLSIDSPRFSLLLLLTVPYYILYCS